MGKVIKNLVVMSLVLTVLLAGTPVLAFSAGDTGLDKSADIAGFKVSDKTELPVLIGNIIQAFLLFLGLLLLIIVIYGGIQYMLAGGNEEQVTKAKRWIINGIIGIIIISLAYSLSAFVLARVAGAVTGS